jgi:Cu(I)/Ag(I) efflux system protein CusF
MKISILFVLILAISACLQNSAETRNQTVKPTATESPMTTPTPSKNGNYPGKGVVTKIDLKLVSVELDHEEIKGLMPKMIMEFYVKEKAELEKLKVGDKVDFVVEYRDGQEKIISIKKAE